MATEMLSFYKNKVILLTGGTGFLGKVLVEKLLRSTEVKCIYLLIRQKRGRSISQRIEDLFSDPLFATLLETNPDVKHSQRVKAVYGDCVLPNLGLSSSDALKLIEEVDVLVHGAATVRFDETLSVALTINLRATVDLIQLAKRMVKLKAFVHVSSAFANCTVSHIEERYYVDQIGVSAERICSLLDQMGADHINSMDETLRGAYPNTYCFSKALAEDVVLTQGTGLPICVFRPGIVISTCKEPAPGWIDNLYGPTSILLGVASGLLRVIYAHMDCNATLVPVDYCANGILACVWHTSVASKTPATKPPIFNLVPVSDNVLQWREYRRILESSGKKIPLSGSLWYPFLIDTESELMYAVLTFLLHTLPGYLMDFGLLLMGRKRRMVKMYTKIHKQTGVLRYFMRYQWTFDTSNSAALWQMLSPEDQQLFPFDMSSIDWTEFFYNSFVGMRIYLAKDDPVTIPKALRRMKLFLIIHRTLQMVLCGGALLLLFWTIKWIMKLN